MDYCQLFGAVYPGRKPYPYQEAFSRGRELPTLLGIPTGVGKTAAVLGGWLYRRRFHPDASVREQTPRRLVYCLPMRVLVEQTYAEAKTWLGRLGMLAEPDGRSAGPVGGFAAEHGDDGLRIAVHVLMGGEQGGEWDWFPDRDAILIGTQDMLLSRALNRGYGMSRYRWPVHFALLNNDCLWVLDETQLMGVGVTTSAQLDGLRTKLSTYGPAQTLWMSATLDAGELSTVDHPTPEDGWSKLELSPEDRALEAVQSIIGAAKPCSREAIVLSADSKKSGYEASLAEDIAQFHRPGTLTLVVINQVDRAQSVFKALEKCCAGQDIAPQFFLIHSRFRPNERGPRQEEALNEQTIPEAGRIIVTTQAIEAGVDVSATTLFTELAPWSSMVQRFGRCNRRGVCGTEGRPEAQVVWIDIDTSDAKKSKELALPYSAEALDAARGHIVTLSDVGPQSLEDVTHEEPRKILHTLRRKDLIELWDTTPDLAGNDLDVSRYIRDADDTDVQVYWRDWDLKQNRGWPPDPRDESGRLVFPAPVREELCAVSVARSREFVKKLKSHSAWRWNRLDRSWQQVRPNEVRPGTVVLLHVDAGGYDATLGWTGDAKHKPEAVALAQQEDNETMDDEELGEKPIFLAQHSSCVVSAAGALKESLADMPDGLPWESIATAAEWHDVGKAHPAFRNAMRDFEPIQALDPEGVHFWAKSGERGILRYRMIEKDEEGKSGRPGFRHELASALAWLDQAGGEANADLVAFLIVAHHGKVRGSIRSLPNEIPPPDPETKFARGLWEGDEIPPIELGDGRVTSKVTIDLSLMELGEDADGRPSWLARILKLRDQYGPFRLAYLETLLRIADWHGSNAGEPSHV